MRAVVAHITRNVKIIGTTVKKTSLKEEKKIYSINLNNIKL